MIWPMVLMLLQDTAETVPSSAFINNIGDRD